MSATSSPVRRARRFAPTAVIVLLLAAVASLLSASLSPADAQTSVVGTADFRNAPQLLPGTHRDVIVTGDSAWYSLVYTNGTPYEFAVEFEGQAAAGAELTVSFVAPTLATVNGPSQSIASSGVTFPSGHTNLWFLRVSLDSPDIGLEFPIVISVDGVQSVGVADCSDTPGCNLDAELAQLNAAVSEAESELEARGNLQTSAAVNTEISNLQGFADSSATLLPPALARLENNESTIARLCAPEPTCETFPSPTPTTPTLGWLVGFGALIIGAYVAVKRANAPTEEVADPSPPRKDPANVLA